jgi:GAF domain-containing protein
VKPSDGAAPRHAQDLHRAAEALSGLSRESCSDDVDLSLQMLVALAARLVSGNASASVTLLRHGHFRTVAASSTEATDVDALQYDLRTGPCVDAVLEGSTFLTGDLEHEERWQPLGRRLSAELGVRSMLAFRLHLLDETETIAALNFSSHELDAFTCADVDLGMLLATQCAFLVTASQAQQKADNLFKALESNREIGVAVGVLMARYGLSRTQAFDVLRLASQHSNRKLRDVAAEVSDTGLAPAT